MYHNASYRKLRPTCSLHGMCIEQVKGGKASWRCNKSNCKLPFVGLDMGRICLIWQEFWGDEINHYKEFRKKLIHSSGMQQVPFYILCEAMEKNYKFELIEEYIEIKRLELLASEIEDTENLDRLALVSSESFKKLRSKKACEACSIFPDILGNCFC